MTSSFHHSLRRLVAEKHLTACTDLHQLCRGLRGAFPTDILAALGKHRRFAAVEHAVPRSMLDLRLPEPHPVDYDWRFDGATAASLADLAMEHGAVLCVGTPTVYDAIGEANGRACLIDRNPLLVSFLRRTSGCRFIIDDIASIYPTDIRVDERFSSAVLDPPWYPYAYDQWLARTIPLMVAGGTIFLILFREFTRQNAEKERADLLNRLTAIGTISYPLDAATYSTPIFELEVLARLGVPRLTNWRAADVVKVELFPNVSSWPFEASIAAAAPKWRRFVVGDQVLAIEIRSRDNGPVTYSPPPPCVCYELESVSGRDPCRSKIAVWTSRNRAAAATGTERISAFMAAMVGDLVPVLPLTAADKERSRELAIDLQIGVQNAGHHSPAISRHIERRYHRRT
jgi:hypothetical protein